MRHLRLPIWWPAVALLAACGPAAVEPSSVIDASFQARAPARERVDLGTLGGTHAEAYAINSAGQVVGHSDTAGDAQTHAFLWTSRDGMVDLGTLGGARSTAFAISDSGYVAGWSATADRQVRAFRWSRAEGMIDLGVATAANLQIAVNNAGDVAGTADFQDPGRPPSQRAFLWTKQGGLRDLGGLGGIGSSAAAINSAGWVVGTSATAAGPRAFVWTKEDGMLDLGTLGGTYSGAIAVSDSGIVVGTSEVSRWVEHAFMWTRPGGMVDLGALADRGSHAFDVSNDGTVVGMSDVDDGTYYGLHPFAWTNGDGMTDLYTYGTPLRYANGTVWAISPSGRYAAGDMYTMPGGVDTFEVFLWTRGIGSVALDTSGTFGATAADVNNRGEVVGHFLTPTDDPLVPRIHAALWR